MPLPFVCGAVAVALASGASECQPAWVPEFGDPGMNSSVSALTVFDDGSGPALVAGGNMTMAGGVPVTYIAKWNGIAWTAIGQALLGQVFALTVFDDGNGPALYVGGNFTNAGTQFVSYIAKWDGDAWSGLGGGMDAPVLALIGFDDGNGPALYAGGQFATAGGNAVNFVAKWNGSNWSAMDGGTNHWVHALAVHDDGSGPALYAGGQFANAGGSVVGRVAKWSGGDWIALGVGVNGIVRALSSYDDGSGAGVALFAGGGFFSAGGNPAGRLAKWANGVWTTTPFQMSGDVHSLHVFDDGTGDGSALFAGGLFTSAGGTPANRIARWNGAAWSALGSGTGQLVAALASYDAGDGNGPALYLGGAFQTAGGVTANRIAKWQGCPVCAGDADFNCDGAVDGDDLGELLGQWGPCPGCPADLNGDGVVDGDDLGALLGSWS